MGALYKICPFTIVADNREQHPWSFLGFKCDSPYADHDLIVSVRNATLQTGDYSLQGYEDQITIERKSLSDLYQTLGQGRNRFIRELERMRDFKFAALVTECDWATICCHPPSHSKLNPKSVFRSLLAFAQRYGVHIYPMPTRIAAEQISFRILQRFWIDNQLGGFYDSDRLTKGKMAEVQPSNIGSA